MATTDIEIVPLDQVPITPVLELLRLSLGPAAVERSEEYWRWKHVQSPFGPSPGLVAMAAGRPVALRVFMRWWWRSQGVTLSALRAVDSATHPDWRRRGLFRLLTGELLEQERERGAAFVFNTPNRTSRAGYLAMGWRDLGRTPLLVRPTHLVAGLATAWRHPDRGPAAAAPPAALRPVAELLDQPDLPVFLAAWGQTERRLHTPRSVRYLQWRYASAPGVSYGALWKMDGATGALLVARTRRRRGLTEVTLSELLLSEDQEGRRAAAELIGRIAASPRVRYLAALAVRESSERKAVRASGFFPLPCGPRLAVRQLNTEEPDPTLLCSWRPSVGDLELF